MDALALFARKASMLVHACHLVLSSLCTRLGASCSFHGFACWGVHGGCFLSCNFFFHQPTLLHELRSATDAASGLLG